MNDTPVERPVGGSEPPLRSGEQPAAAGRERTGRRLPWGLGLLLLVIAASWWWVAAEHHARGAMGGGTSPWEHAARFLARLAGAGTAEPAFLDPDAWLRALQLAGETLFMSILAAGFAGMAMLLTVVPAARTAADGTLTLVRSRGARIVFLLLRGVYIFSRAVPELIWAMLIIFVFKPGILPGALALGLHNFGILGKLCAEVVEDADSRPARALRTCGAGRLQILLYGLLPQVYPQFLTYLLYRWEVIIRTTVVVGFVSAGGLGHWFRLSMSWFHYTDITLLLICYLLLVWLVDGISAGLRRMAR